MEGKEDTVSYNEKGLLLNFDYMLFFLSDTLECLFADIYCIQ